VADEPGRSVACKAVRQPKTAFTLGATRGQKLRSGSPKAATAAFGNPERSERRDHDYYPPLRGLPLR